jgi:hypothetical protein
MATRIDERLAHDFVENQPSLLRAVGNHLCQLGKWRLMSSLQHRMGEGGSKS